ncbi:protein contaning Peptidase C65 [Pseudoloma neurophilia]|uniref:Protein contaning Peptidase C65 n=1 Tax=Pseudoloma neurophilia TaxID=146866 RepID=A0A0R0M8V1_9MICR|nr:protein contaning Peptidase C65 [Pseudoloma neurophilia]
MRTTTCSILYPVTSHPLYRDDRFEKAFKLLEARGFTHYCQVSRNGNCFYTAMVLCLLKNEIEVNQEYCKDLIQVLGLDEFVWEEYYDLFTKYLDEREELFHKITFNEADMPKEEFQTDCEALENLSCLIEDKIHLSDEMKQVGGQENESENESFQKDHSENESQALSYEDIKEKHPVLSKLPFNELTMLLKFVISGEMTKNKKEYAPFLTMSISEYLSTVIQPMFRITDSVGITACANALELNMAIFCQEGEKLFGPEKKSADLGILHSFDHFEPFLRLENHKIE